MGKETPQSLVAVGVFSGHVVITLHAKCQCS